MPEKVKLSKDGSSIDFVQSDSIPTSLKKFRQSPEIEGFYRFIFENDLQKEAYEIMNRLVMERKAKKALAKKEVREAAKAAAQSEVKIPKSNIAPEAKTLKATVLVKEKLSAEKEIKKSSKVITPAPKIAPAPKKKTTPSSAAKPAKSTKPASKSLKKKK
jgi:hypothetical protein